MNDSKYGRLYPERAVAPLRELAEKYLDWARQDHDETGVAEWTAVLEGLDRQGFPPAEPLFLLRGQDVLAHYVVREYAKDVATSDAFGGRLSPEQVDVIHHLEDFADRMEAWQPRKLPD